MNRFDRVYEIVYEEGLTTRSLLISRVGAYPPGHPFMYDLMLTEYTTDFIGCVEYRKDHRGQWVSGRL